MLFHSLYFRRRCYFIHCTSGVFAISFLVLPASLLFHSLYFRHLCYFIPCTSDVFAISFLVLPASLLFNSLYFRRLCYFIPCTSGVFAISYLVLPVSLLFHSLYFWRPFYFTQQSLASLLVYSTDFLRRYHLRHRLLFLMHLQSAKLQHIYVYACYYFAVYIAL